MSDLITLTIKIVFLAVVWLFILFVANVVRTDMFGKRVPVSSLAAVPADRGRPKKSKKAQIPTRFAITSGAQQGMSVPVSATINLGERPIARCFWTTTMPLRVTPSSSNETRRPGWYMTSTPPMAPM